MSHTAALAFKEWLSNVLPGIRLYVSSEDVEKGQRWNVSVSKELEASSFGILFVTRQNQNAPWLLFEAGALSKAFESSRVVPFLLNIAPNELKGPISQFQCVEYNKADTFKLLTTIAKLLPGGSLEESRLDTIFNVWWEHLNTKMLEILDENRSVTVSNHLMLSQSVPWIPLIVQTDPQQSSYAIGDCIVFDQPEFGAGYAPSNIRVSFSERHYALPDGLQDIADRYRSKQIGDNLPHYIITRFKNSEIDFPEVELELSRCWYMDIRSIQAAIQSEPNQVIDAAGATLTDRLLMMAPLNFSTTAVPAQLSVNIAIVTSSKHEKPHLVLIQRGPEHQVGYYPEAWSVSMQETMSAGSSVDIPVAHDGDRNLFRCAVRGIKEEILGEEIPEHRIEFQCFFLEGNVFNQSSMAIATLSMSFQELCHRRRYLADDKRESGFICAVPFEPEVLRALLNGSEFDLEYALRVGKWDCDATAAPLNQTRGWHPTSRLAIFMTLRRYFPKDARSWILEQLGYTA